MLSEHLKNLIWDTGKIKITDQTTPVQACAIIPPPPPPNFAILSNRIFKEVNQSHSFNVEERRKGKYRLWLQGRDLADLLNIDRFSYAVPNGFTCESDSVWKRTLPGWHRDHVVQSEGRLEHSSLCFLHETFCNIPYTNYKSNAFYLPPAQSRKSDHRQ